MIILYRQAECEDTYQVPAEGVCLMALTEHVTSAAAIASAADSTWPTRR
jgi:hypothetical protein